MRLLPIEAAAAPWLAGVHAQAFDAPWSADALARLLAGAGVYGFAAVDVARAGFVLCRAAAGEMEVLTLAVAPAARRRGVARGLMAAALAAGRAAGAEQVFLEVAASNLAALGLYEGLGFERAGVRSAYYDRGGGRRDDALVMRLDLRAADF